MAEICVCEHCSSKDVIKKGTVLQKSGETKYRYRCKSCTRNFYRYSVDIDPVESSSIKPDDKFNRDEVWVATKLLAEKFVITSVQSNTPVNKEFLDAIKMYCIHNGAELLIIPVRYKNPSLPTGAEEVHEYDASVQEYIFENNIRIHEKLRVLGLLKIGATAENPLTGLSPLSKGDSLVIGHGQLQLTTLPVQVNDHPVVLTTTGSISEKRYSSSKQGYKAEFNHSMSAVVVELDGDFFHIRHLNFDGEGFFDLAKYYTPTNVESIPNSVTALITGDEHAIFMSPSVKTATYGKHGIVDTLHPEFLVRHDVLDCYSISHHHKHNLMIKFKKFITKKNSIADELVATVNLIKETTPHGCTNILVPSNHTDHLTRWLNECDVRHEPWNARLYHNLMHGMLSHIEDSPSTDLDPFELYSRDLFDAADCKVMFLNRRSTCKILDIEVAIHGDKGGNGARGSRKNLSLLPTKSIIGHSHSPGIEKGCYQVGTSSILTLEYNDGPSSWMNTHCLIYSNGKRQLINIINGKWCS